MFELLPVDQLPEILVVCDENSVFSPGNLEDFVILDRSGVGPVRKGYPGSQRIVMTITQAARNDAARLS